MTDWLYVENSYAILHQLFIVNYPIKKRSVLQLFNMSIDSCHTNSNISYEFIRSRFSLEHTRLFAISKLLQSIRRESQQVSNHPETMLISQLFARRKMIDSTSTFDTYFIRSYLDAFFRVHKTLTLASRSIPFRPFIFGI